MAPKRRVTDDNTAVNTPSPRRARPTARGGSGSQAHLTLSARIGRWVCHLRTFSGPEPVIVSRQMLLEESPLSRIDEGLREFTGPPALNSAEEFFEGVITTFLRELCPIVGPDGEGTLLAGLSELFRCGATCGFEGDTSGGSALIVAARAKLSRCMAYLLTGRVDGDVAGADTAAADGAPLLGRRRTAGDAGFVDRPPPAEEDPFADYSYFSPSRAQLVSGGLEGPMEMALVNGDHKCFDVVYRLGGGTLLLNTYAGRLRSAAVPGVPSIGSEGVLRTLVAFCPSAMKARDFKAGSTILLLTLLHAEPSDASLESRVRICIDNGANVNVTDRYLNTPLQLAIHRGLGVAVVEALLKAGANPNAKGRYGPTFFSVLYYGGYDRGLKSGFFPVRPEMLEAMDKQSADGLGRPSGDGGRGRGHCAVLGAQSPYRCFDGHPMLFGDFGAGKAEHCSLCFKRRPGVYECALHCPQCALVVCADCCLYDFELQCPGRRRASAAGQGSDGGGHTLTLYYPKADAAEADDAEVADEELADEEIDDAEADDAEADDEELADEEAVAEDIRGRCIACEVRMVGARCGYYCAQCDTEGGAGPSSFPPQISALVCLKCALEHPRARGTEEEEFSITDVDPDCLMVESQFDRFHFLATRHDTPKGLSAAVDIMRALVAFGADLTATGRTRETFAHRCAAQQGTSTVVRLLEVFLDLAPRGAPNMRDVYGDTPLHHVLRHAQPLCDRVAEVLINHGAAIDAVNNSLMTPIHCLGSGGRSDCIEWSTVVTMELLLANGASVSAADADGNTLLHYLTVVPDPYFDDAEGMTELSSDDEDGSEDEGEREWFGSDERPLRRRARVMYCRLLQIVLDAGAVDAEVEGVDGALLVEGERVSSPLVRRALTLGGLNAKMLQLAGLFYTYGPLGEDGALIEEDGDDFEEDEEEDDEFDEL